MKRRETLKFLGAGIAGLTTLNSQKSFSLDTAPPLNVNSPEDLHYIHKKLAYSLDERLTYWYIRAVRYGFKDGVLTPFWNMHVGIIYKLKNIADHHYKVQAAMKIFYSDLETGEMLEWFNNPYTGERREVAQPGLALVTREHDLKGVVQPSFDINSENKNGPVTRNGNIGPAWVIGDDIWINGDVVYRAELPNDLGQLISVNDWSTYHGSMKQINDPDIMSADATHTFNDLNTFNHTWIGMEGIKAWSVSRGFGRKSQSIDDMPDKWKKFVSKTNPELLENNPDIFTSF